MPQPTPTGGGVIDQLRNAETSLIKLNAFAQTLKAYRKENKLTLAETAEQTGVSASTLSRIENAKFAPKFETVVTLCDWMEAPIEDFAEIHVESENTLERVAVHLRADRKLSTDGAQQIIEVVKALYEAHARKEQASR